MRSAQIAQQLFKRRFGYQAVHTVTAPGRLELLGAHAEQNEGLSLVLAVNRFVQIAAAPRQDGKIELVSSAGNHREIFWLSRLEKNPENPWADPAKGVLFELRRRGVGFGGFNAAICSEIPPEVDFGEQAAVQVATALIVRKLYPFKLTVTGCMSRPPQRDRRGQVPAPAKPERLALADLCQQAQERFLETESSWSDHLATLFGKAFHALGLDRRLGSLEALPMIGEIVTVVCPSGVVDKDASRKIEQLRGDCRSAAHTLQARSLRSVDLAHLSTYRMRLDDREYACAYHVVGETQRVVFAERALRDGDFLQLGQYLLQSHESARDFFQNSFLEADLLVDLARDHPGCLGARLSGPGYGGATVNLVGWNSYESFLAKIPWEYERHTGRRITPIVCQIVDGAQ